LTKTTRAIELPSTLTLQESSIPNAGLGVFSLSEFEVGSLFGPLEGEERSLDENKKNPNDSFVWEVNILVLHGCYLLLNTRIYYFY